MSNPFTNIEKEINVFRNLDGLYEVNVTQVFTEQIKEMFSDVEQVFSKLCMHCHSYSRDHYLNEKETKDIFVFFFNWAIELEKGKETSLEWFIRNAEWRPLSRYECLIDFRKNIIDKYKDRQDKLKKFGQSVEF